MTASGPAKPQGKAWKRPVIWAFRVASAVGLAVWIRAFVAAPPAFPAGTIAEGPRYRASGVVHIHTNLSDGRGTPAEVLAAGRKAGADFLVITDHNRVDPSAFDSVSQPGDPIVIVGSEISTEAGHVLAIGIRAPTFRFSGTLTEVLEDIRHLGGCAFAAHPTSPRGETRFTREDEPGNWGVEIVNGDTAWREASAGALALTAWMYPANPGFALARTLKTFETERGLWDRVLARRFAPALGGTDAHGRIPLTRTSSLPVPSYEALFSLVRTVAHLDEPLSPIRDVASQTISRALCAGQSVVAIPALGDPKGFSFVARTSEGPVAGPGSTLRFRPGLTLHALGAMPPGTTLRLIESGKMAIEMTDTLEYPVVRPGVYRIEAYTPGETTPWILTNPISVLTADMDLARDAAAKPFHSTHVLGKLMLDSFDGPTAFAAEHDPGSSVVTPIIDSGGGRGGGGAARLDFRLNATPQPPVWCALVDRTKRDLSTNQGISFWLKGDGEYRVWFQIRDQNPASADDGTEAWFASVRTSEAWTLHNIPFKSLRSINRTSDGSFDPAKIAHVVFVIDHGAMAYGSTGKVWVDDLKAY